MHFRGVLFICHGIGDHSLWYEDLADILVKIGFYVFTHDHGRSDVHYVCLLQVINVLKFGFTINIIHETLYLNICFEDVN